MDDKKQQKREQIIRNRAKGKAGEFEARVMYNLGGYETHKRPDNPGGPDYDLIKRNLLSHEIMEEKTMEVKTGNAKLSKKQESADIIYRTNAFPHNLFNNKH